MDPVLITLAHGSRHPRSGLGTMSLTRAAARLAGTAGYAANLEIATPSLPELAATLPPKRRAVVVPLLFTEAYHARVDVPAAVDSARSAGLDLACAPGIGLGDDLVEVLRRVIIEDAPATSRVILYSVGSSDTQAGESVRSVARRLAAVSGHPTQLITATNGPRPAPEELRIAARECAASGAQGLHIVPLFVSEGLLLDRLVGALPTIERETAVTITRSPELGARLAGLVSQRYLQAARAFFDPGSGGAGIDHAPLRCERGVAEHAGLVRS